MVFLTQPPCARLAPYVQALWYFEGDFASQLEGVLPTGAMQLLVNLDADRLRWYAGERREGAGSIGGAGVSGCHAGRFFIDVGDQRRVAGVRFRPGGAALVCRAPAGALFSRHVDLGDLWPGGGRVREQLLEPSQTPAAVLSRLEATLLSHVKATVEDDRGLAWAIGALERGARVGAVVDRLGGSPRRFISQFEARVGLKPKAFARVARFQRALRVRAAGRAWADVAACAGYADQAHLTRDFREFAGVTPAAYVVPAGAEVEAVGATD